MHIYSFSYTGCGHQYHRLFKIVIKAFWFSTSGGKPALPFSDSNEDHGRPGYDKP